MNAVPLDDDRWRWGLAEPCFTEVRGRPCVRIGSETSGFLATLPAVQLTDGEVEADVLVGRERSFPGVVWRVEDDANFESFFVRPHQVGNPDAIQYTPVFNGVSAWQLYHGDGFWAPTEFPLDEWFTIRVVFSGTRAQAYVADLDTPALEIRELKRGDGAGTIGLLAGGPALHVARFTFGATTPALEPMPLPEPLPGAIRSWLVSDAFPEARIGDELALDGRHWTPLESEPSGLTDLARVNGIDGDRNTVHARATVRSDSARTSALTFGYSDRVSVYLNGRRLFTGDDTYRSRDYRFLGSIGWLDTLHVALEPGDNEIVFAVSESFGGWGVQARFADDAGLELDPG